MCPPSFASLVSVVVFLAIAGPQKPAEGPGRPSAGPVRTDSEAARFTREKLLGVMVNGEFTEVRLGDILKEFAAQADMKCGQPVMWSYGMGFPFDKKVTFRVNNQPLAAALDDLLTRSGTGLGYLIVSMDGDRRDGWIQLTTTGERGRARQPATAEEEKSAAELLASATRLLDAKKDASAQVLLQLILKKYPATRAARDAKGLLEKINK